MGFVKVQHKDGRVAEITAAEVAFYRTIGFKPADGSVIETSGDSNARATAPVQAPANGTDQRLDLILDELRALRADLAGTSAPADDPIDGETIDLREPGEAGTGNTTSEPTTTTTTAAPKPAATTTPKPSGKQG